MSETLARKWAAARRLFEEYGAPKSLLDQILGRAMGAVEKRSLEEGWHPVDQSADASKCEAVPFSTASEFDLHRHLAALFGAQLSRFQSDEQSTDPEKRARALSIQAKTLESIAAIGLKLGVISSEQSTSQTGSINDPNSRSQATETAELDRQLTELIGNLAQDGKGG